MIRDGLLSNVDPRARIIVAFVLGTLLSFVQDDRVLMVGLVGSVVLAGLARGEFLFWARRAARWNLFFLLAFVTIPFASPGPGVFHVAGLSYGWDGLHFVVKLLLRANALILLFAALVGQMDPFTLAHALRHLHVPERLTALIFFVDRCQELLGRESGRRFRALRARGYRSTWRLRSWRVWGNFVGALFLSGSDRVDRCLGAMRCRGFDGHVRLFRHFKMRGTDLVFWAGAVSWAVFLLVMEGG
jgi:cobalt/nickel transport system permease protein